MLLAVVEGTTFVDLAAGRLLLLLKDEGLDSLHIVQDQHQACRELGQQVPGCRHIDRGACNHSVNRECDMTGVYMTGGSVNRNVNKDVNMTGGSVNRNVNNNINMTGGSRKISWDVRT